MITKWIKRFRKKIVKVEEESYQDKEGRRMIEVITLECKHMFWREKLGIVQFMELANKYDERICEACLREHLLKRFGRGGNLMFKIWEKMRKLII